MWQIFSFLLAAGITYRNSQNRIKHEHFNSCRSYTGRRSNGAVTTSEERLCLRRLSHVESHLAGRAGQSHSSLQLRQDLLLQAVQLVSSGSASFGHSVQLVAASVHQVVVDGEQRLVMDLRNHMSTLMLSSLDNEGCSQRNRRCVPASCCTDGPASSGCC